MADVCLMPVTAENYAECIKLRVHDWQAGFVAPNLKSLAEAHSNANLYPLAIYDRAALGHERPPVPMVGFTMYELSAGVGFIARLMIDRAHQGQGYGRAAMVELIRRLKLIPEVQLIATSHRRENVAAGALYCSLEFVEWSVAWASENPDELYLMLADRMHAES